MKTDPCTYVIFGATGNLARIKLIPALYHLDIENRLDDDTKIIAIGRRPWDNDKWVSEVRDMLEAKARGGIDEQVFIFLVAPEVGFFNEIESFSGRYGIHCRNNGKTFTVGNTGFVRL